MKLAIITYHRAVNYGSALQAFALNHYLKTKGHFVRTIDYYNDEQKKIYQKYEESRNVMSIARNIYTFIYRKKHDEKDRRFKDFIETFVPLTNTIGNDEKKLASIENEFDTFICGSDQIWNTNCYDFDNNYLLSFVKNKKKCCAYAPSIGTDRLDADSEKLLKKYLSEYRLLSVREKTGAKYLEQLIKRQVDNVLDPVFLLDNKEWRKMSNAVKVKGKYVLGYYIGDVAGMRDYGKKLAKKTGCKVIVIWKGLRDVFRSDIKAYDAGPREFLWLIDNAEYICTNSFHAVAFSVIFEKKFWVFVGANDDKKPQSRIYDITEMLGLSNRILNETNCRDVDFNSPIDWKNVYEKLNFNIQKSKRYLDKIINMEDSYGVSMP